MLSGVHILLTYSCTFECDHCFLHSAPSAPGTFTVKRMSTLIAQAKELPSVEWIFFEGGEPFLYYPLLLLGLRLAQQLGFRTGLVSNCYWATSEADARLWLEPVAEAGVDELQLSDDAYHHGDDPDSPAKRAVAAARELGLPANAICIDRPKVASITERERGAPIVGGTVMFRGRAAHKLIDPLPTRPWKDMQACLHEELIEPQRLHIDAYGHVHICQGVSIGNVFERPLAEVIADYEPTEHPIVGPLVRGGPAELARTYQVPRAPEYVDECHLCYRTRRALVDRFPEALTPRQVYGLE